MEKQAKNRDTVRAWAQLHRASRVQLEHVEAALRQAGLPPLNWYDVLIELYWAEDARMRQYELSDAVLLPKHGISRLIDRMEADGVVLRESCETDRRGAYICLTQPGEDLLRKMWRVYGPCIDATFSSKLTRAELRSLQKILPKLADR